MTDEQIIKALECCKNLNCSECPKQGNIFAEECDVELCEEAVDLIKRKDAEIINRTEEYNDMLEQRNKVEEALEVMTMDVKSLTNERDALEEMFQDQNAENLKLKQQHKAQIERLQKRVKGQKHALFEQQAYTAKLQEEIERLKEYEIALKKGCALSRCINKGFVQVEAYKEFYDKLTEKATIVIRKDIKGEPIDRLVYLKDIDNTLKELTEGGNEE